MLKTPRRKAIKETKGLTNEEIEVLCRKAEEKYGSTKLRTIFHVKNESEDFYIVVSKPKPAKSFMEFLKVDYIESGECRKARLGVSERESKIDGYLFVIHYFWNRQYGTKWVEERFEVNPYPDEEPELIEKR